MENIVQGQWFGTSGADLGTPISQSLRFDPEQSTNISRTLAARNSNTSTVAFWLKNFNSDWGGYSTPTPFVAYTDSNNYVQFQFDRDTRGMILRINAVVGGSNVIDKQTTGNFADPSAWYHIAVVFDTGNATAEDRTRLYVNGYRCTNWDTNTNCSQSQGISVNTAVEHNFGKQSNFSACGGNLADVYFLDGIAVSHNSDGFIDEFVRLNDQGICVPKAYSGSYNQNGFHLDFNSTTLDTSNTRFTDQSGQGNHFTYSNFNTTASNATYLLSNDTPTDNYAVMVHNSGHSGASSDPDFEMAGTIVNTWDSTHKSIHSTFAVKEGKYYWELYRPSSGTFYGGIADVETEYWHGWLGQKHWCFGINDSGNICHMVDENLGSAGAIGQNVTFGNTIDFDNDEWKGYVDGSAMFSGNNMLVQEQHIDRNDGGSTTRPRRISPAWGHASHTKVEFHTGAHGGFTDGFREDMPSGFKKLRTSDLPDLAVKRPQDHFRVVNYGGNNADRTINFGFRPDLVCIFQTTGSSSDHNKIFDSCNGLTTGYYSMSISDAFTTDSDYITGVSDTGVTIKSGASNEAINEDSHRYSAWGFKMGGAPTASNSNTSGAMAANSVSIDGELQSAYTPPSGTDIYPYKMSINTEAKMSIIRYEGNNTDGATLPHGLGEPPACIWIKRMSSNSEWRVYHHCEDMGPAANLDFDRTDGRSTDDSWNAVHPNSDHIVLGNVSNVNWGSTYIAICFAEVPGFSAFGQFEPNQSAEGPYCVTMFEPALVFGKLNHRADHWWAFDNVQTRVNERIKGYRLNTNNANDSNLGGLEFFANGFRHREASGEHNYGSDYGSYFAFAHRPFGGENSAPNTAHFDSNLTE